jgi:hypothetical protein
MKGGGGRRFSVQEPRALPRYLTQPETECRISSEAKRRDFIPNDARLKDVPRQTAGYFGPGDFLSAGISRSRYQRSLRAAASGVVFTLR